MGRGDLNGKIRAFMKEILLMGLSKDMENITLLTLTNGMKENSE